MNYKAGGELRAFAPLNDKKDNQELFLILAKIGNYKFVVSSYYETDGAYNQGHYFEGDEDAEVRAFEYFTERLKKERKRKNRCAATLYALAHKGEGK